MGKTVTAMYYACVECFEPLKSKDFLGQDLDYCDNERCSRYGFWTLAWHYITKPEDVQFWKTQKEIDNHE